MKQAAGSSAILITVLPAVFDRNLLFAAGVSLFNCEPYEPGCVSDLSVPV